MSLCDPPPLMTSMLIANPRSTKLSSARDDKVAKMSFFKPEWKDFQRISGRNKTSNLSQANQPAAAVTFDKLWAAFGGACRKKGSWLVKIKRKYHFVRGGGTKKKTWKICTKLALYTRRRRKEKLLTSRPIIVKSEALLSRLTEQSFWQEKKRSGGKPLSAGVRGKI